MYSFDNDIEFNVPSSTSFSGLIIGDPHFKLDAISEIENYRECILSIVRDKKPDFVVILGDVLHNHANLHTTMLNLAQDFIYDLSLLCNVYVLVGNHDYINNSQFLSTSHWMTAMKKWKNVVIVDQGFVDHERNLVFCPYVPPGRLKEALQTFDSDWKTRTTLFAHQEFFGSKHGAFESEIGDKWETDDPFVLSGHIHERQLVGTNVYYVGSSRYTSFGEYSAKTVSLVNWTLDKMVVSQYELSLTKKITLYRALKDVNDLTLPESENCNIRVVLNGTYEEFKSFQKSKKYKEWTKKKIKIKFVKKTSHKTLTDTTVEKFTDLLWKRVLKDKNEFMTQTLKDAFKDQM